MFWKEIGAGEGIRTLDPNLGKRWKAFSPMRFVAPFNEIPILFNSINTTEFASMRSTFLLPAYPLLTRVL